MPELLHLDPELAARAERLFRELGLDLHTAVHLFLLQSLREQALPFTLRLASGSRSSSPAHDEPEAAPAVKDTVPSAGAAAETIPSEQETEPLEGETITPVLSDSERVPEAHQNDAASTDVFNTSESAGYASLDELRQAFLNMKLIGAPLRRVRSLNRLYAIGEANPHVPGWREVYVSGDEPFALDFGTVRVELGYSNGGSLRMMDGRLPDDLLEADAIFPRDLSSIFSSVEGQPLTDVTSSRVRGHEGEAEQLRLHFANGCTLVFMPAANWAALWLTDAQGSVMYAPEAVWRRTLGEHAWQALR